MAEGFRNKLIDQALLLFSARGYDGVSVQEIVEAAGVTKPTLYHYFGSKRGLLEALFSERLASLREAVHRAARFEGDLVMNLRTLARAWVDFARQEPAVFRLLLSSQYAPLESELYRAGAGCNTELLEHVEQLFAQALPHFQHRSYAYAFTFIGILNNDILLALQGALPLDEEQLQGAVHQFMHGIFS